MQCTFPILVAQHRVMPARISSIVTGITAWLPLIAQIRMLQLAGHNKRNLLHLAVTLGADQPVSAVNFLNQTALSLTIVFFC